jgi:hypothetical protein
MRKEDDEVSCSMVPTQQGLQASAALCQPLLRVTLWEEHR